MTYSCMALLLGFKKICKFLKTRRKNMLYSILTWNRHFYLSRDEFVVKYLNIFSYYKKTQQPYPCYNNTVW